MKDITIELDGYILNSRCAALIIHDEKVLLHKSTNTNYYATIGGRIGINENSEDAVKREVKEETGKEIEILSFRAIIESFFEKDGKKYHEYLFLYDAEFKNEDDKKITHTMEAVEIHKKGKLQFEWINISDLIKIDVRPEIVKDLLLNKISNKHIITK